MSSDCFCMQAIKQHTTTVKRRIYFECLHGPAYLSLHSEPRNYPHTPNAAQPGNDPFTYKTLELLHRNKQYHQHSKCSDQIYERI